MGIHTTSLIVLAALLGATRPVVAESMRRKFEPTPAPPTVKTAPVQTRPAAPAQPAPQRRATTPSVERFEAESQAAAQALEQVRPVQTTPVQTAPQTQQIQTAPVVVKEPVKPPPAVQAKPAGKEEAIDLNALDSSTPSNSTQASAPAMHSGHPGGLVDPHFSVLFDLLLAYQPGKAEFSFLNFHPLLLAEIVPTPDLVFSFEVNPSPRYFELDYQAAWWVQLRAGKIWIPFDDLNPHNVFGGRLNASKMRLANTAFLPDLFTDLGVGAKFTLVDTLAMTITAHAYVVNGFPTGGTDPVSGVTDYPNFNDIPVSISDGNRDKAMGGRFHVLLRKTFGIGVSYYTGRYTDETSPAARVSILGGDAQVKLGSTELRVGVSKFSVGLTSGINFGRHGEYVELGHKFGLKKEWKLLGRGGLIDMDDRVTNPDDVAVVGGALLYQPSFIQWSIEMNQDIKKVTGKLGYTFVGARAVIQL